MNTNRASVYFNLLSFDLIIKITNITNEKVQDNHSPYSRWNAALVISDMSMYLYDQDQFNGGAIVILLN